MMRITNDWTGSILIQLWIGLLLVAGNGFLSEASAASQQVYAGAARIYNLERVTVVYPAGEGQKADANRISAQRCAAYLQYEYDVPAVAAPDDGVSEEQLRGHLLLLGWDNALLGTDEAPSVFRHGRGAHRFLGSIEIGDEEDLLFAAASPYNPQRFLIFWSRIDPERDRFLVLPFVGSDFAVYDDYKVVHQGMFGNRTVWPPLRSNLSEKIQPASVLRELPEAGRSARFVLHGHFDETAANEILQAREEALSRAVAALGDPPEGFVIELHVYPDSETKENKTGVPDPSHSFPSRRETHMVLTAARASGVREEVHLLSAALFGPTHTTALYDGLAVFLGFQNDPGQLPLYGAMLLQRGELPTIDQLLDEEALRKLIRERVGMAASGLFVQWLLESGGEALLARAYAQNGLNRAHLGSWMGLAPERLDPTLRSWVSMLAGGAQAELAFQTAVEEARQLRAQGDPSAAADALLKALTHKPDDPETLYKLGLALIEAERFESAERYLGHLAGLSVDASDSRYVVFGHYQLGLLCDRLARPQEAEAWFRQVLEFPDEFNSHQMALEALENRIEEGAAGGETAEE